MSGWRSSSWTLLVMYHLKITFYASLKCAIAWSGNLLVLWNLPFCPIAPKLPELRVLAFMSLLLQYSSLSCRHRYDDKGSVTKKFTKAYCRFPSSSLTYIFDEMTGRSRKSSPHITIDAPFNLRLPLTCSVTKLRHQWSLVMAFTISNCFRSVVDASSVIIDAVFQNNFVFCEWSPNEKIRMALPSSFVVSSKTK